jgi:hypothetical protein
MHDETIDKALWYTSDTEEKCVQKIAGEIEFVLQIYRHL